MLAKIQSLLSAPDNKTYLIGSKPNRHLAKFGANLILVAAMSAASVNTAMAESDSESRLKAIQETSFAMQSAQIKVDQALIAKEMRSIIQDTSSLRDTDDPIVIYKNLSEWEEQEHPGEGLKSLKEAKNSNEYPVTLFHGGDNYPDLTLFGQEISLDSDSKKVSIIAKHPLDQDLNQAVKSYYQDLKADNSSDLDAFRFTMIHEVGHAITRQMSINQGGKIISGQMFGQNDSSQHRHINLVNLQEINSDVFASLYIQKEYYFKNKTQIEAQALPPIAPIVMNIVNTRIKSTLEDPEHKTNEQIGYAMQYFITHADQFEKATTAELFITAYHITSQVAPHQNTINQNGSNQNFFVGEDNLRVESLIPTSISQDDFRQAGEAIKYYNLSNHKSLENWIAISDDAELFKPINSFDDYIAQFNTP